MNDGTVIKFGTDGWRELIADGFTFANLGRVTQAYAQYLNSKSNGATNPLVIIGFDTRFLSERFAQHVAEILSANAIAVELFPTATPTSLVSFAVKHRAAQGGLMITASHNAAQYNGFKIKAPWGGSASTEVTDAVEKLIDRSPVLSIQTSTHAVAEVRTADTSIEKAYRLRIETLIDLERIRCSDSHVVIDSMHGCGGNIIHSFLKSGKLTAETIRADRDVTFGGAAPEPIDRYLGALKSRVKETNATIGLATDGDADRLGAVDDQGETMTLHLVVPILLAHLHKNKSLSGEVIFTVSQSVLMRRMSEAYGLKWRETPIGFKYIAEHMLGGDVLIGAEESGGVGVKGHIPERDGIINSLLLLEAVVTAGKPPSAMIRDLQKEFGAFFYDRRDIYLGKQGRAKPKENLFDSRPDQLAGYRIVEATDKDGLKLMLEDDSWVMIRPSGTEPVLRLYAEATSKQKTRSLLEAAEHRWAR